MSEPVRDPVPHAARAVLDLFRDVLADVRFPDLDRTTLDPTVLDRAALEGSERALLDAQCALEDAEAALERARAAVAEQTGALAAKTQRALAYAKVFAEGDAELRERLDAIGAPSKREKSVAEASAAPKRTRKKKSDDEATLFEESGAPPTEAHALAAAADGAVDRAVVEHAELQ